MFSAPKHRNTETSFKTTVFTQSISCILQFYRINQLGFGLYLKKTHENPFQLVLKIYYIGIASRRMKYNISPSIQQSFPINPINRFELIRDSSAGHSRMVTLLNRAGVYNRPQFYCTVTAVIKSLDGLRCVIVLTAHSNRHSKPYKRITTLP